MRDNAPTNRVPSKRRRAIIYTRQSLKKEESISLELQEDVNRAYCDRQGYVVAGVIADQKTGQTWEKRHGIQRVMKMVLAGEAEVVVLYRWSRISRVRLHQAQAICAIEQAGAVVESATEPFDTKTAAGEFGRDMMMDFAVFQGKLIGEQWKETQARRRERGMPHSGGKRFGYILENGRYEIDSRLVDVDRWRYSEYIAGRGFPSLVSQLNRRGIYNTRGRPWSENSLAKNMDSGFSAGLLAMNTRHGRLKVYWIPGAHEAIIDSETWEQYRRARAERHSMPPRSIEPRYPFTGLIYCGDCGYAMVVMNKERTAGFAYRCGRWMAQRIGRTVSIRRALVESAVLAWLAELADDISASSAAAGAAKRVRLRAHVDAKTAAKEVGEIDRQLVTLTLQHTRNVVPEVAYIPARDELMARREEAQKQLDIATVLAASSAQPPREVAVHLIRDWEILPVRERRNLLAKLVRGIVIIPSERPPLPAGVLIVPMWWPIQA